MFAVVPASIETAHCAPPPGPFALLLQTERADRLPPPILQALPQTRAAPAGPLSVWRPNGAIASSGIWVALCVFEVPGGA